MRVLRSLVASTVLVTVCAAPSHAQRGAAPIATAATNRIPRAADGKADLSGVWITGALALLIGDQEARAIAQADAAAGRKPPPS